MFYSGLRNVVVSGSYPSRLRIYLESNERDPIPTADFRMPLTFSLFGHKRARSHSDNFLMPLEKRVGISYESQAFREEAFRLSLSNLGKLKG